MIPKRKGIVIMIDDDGKEYPGHYRVERSLITVSCRYGSKTTQVLSPDSDPEPLATRVLRQIIREKLKK